ncbi:uncharacterized protein (DUF58 family) [Agromyces flavus]|uniref:Uncharacterized conserved protein, DUF58 family, contains vWF domain n=2 Tax=Agromyces flavus TaxID=589382 RepID=A0A1H1PSW7_9MICO|nr:DUF58 domain-containing protein [Agromyces flavus]MCP2367867.1 uncharacterized protein (DUF58 family) [Agromyces flavus]GGI47328.1 membrane protein [Agromyces flavus]SDS14362.1 Uncharacterized conserved protein, DUF58 family, contains vWF domain [Agromyces flavus]
MSRVRAARAQARPRLTRRGIALMAIGGALFVLALWFDLRDIMLLASVGLAMPLAALGFLALRAPRLALTRMFEPPIVGAGGSVLVRLRVQNRSRRAFDGAHWRDLAHPALHPPGEAVLPAVGRHEGMLPTGDDTVRLEYRLRTPRRGVFDVGPLSIAVSDPFGLARIDRIVGTPRELVVTPRVTPLDTEPGVVASVDGTVNALQKRTHPNSDELIAREYRYGDPMRRVHWAATARRGELMVRDEEQRGDPEVRLLLDTALGGRSHHPVAGGHERVGATLDPAFELGVEIAASLGVHLLAHGFRVRLDPVDDPDVTTRAIAAEAGGYRSPGGEAGLLEDLARLEPPRRDARREHPRQVDPAAAARVVRTRRDARMPALVVLVEPAPAAVESLVALRPGVEPAIAFVAESASTAVVERLEEADWRVVRVRRPVDLPAAWSDAWRSAREAARSGGPGAS